jgi:hypothetical protein
MNKLLQEMLLCIFDQLDALGPDSARSTCRLFYAIFSEDL